MQFTVNDLLRTLGKPANTLTEQDAKGVKKTFDLVLRSQRIWTNWLRVARPTPRGSLSILHERCCNDRYE
ncbi:hypothetical protein C6558_37805 [Ensifer sp. NM-2]|uniref:hypothetical protein n=1 Tax=Ensifer sp. NM-2 TaxID=2109730 RepID=UPI000D12404A|nr:hypothetical protein [Ensifer sp. NM-2]PSS59536.1 hypothetical protein C6558_37805 [Ensifer sp. NM-2]